jgi:hypothetical protein
LTVQNGPNGSKFGKLVQDACGTELSEDVDVSETKIICGFDRCKHLQKFFTRQFAIEVIF